MTSCLASLQRHKRCHLRSALLQEQRSLVITTKECMWLWACWFGSMFRQPVILHS